MDCTPTRPTHRSLLFSSLWFYAVIHWHNYETGKSCINTHRLLTHPPATSKPKIEMASLHICVHDLFFSSTILRRRLNILSTYKQKTFMPRVGCLNDTAKCKDTYKSSRNVVANSFDRPIMLCISNSWQFERLHNNLRGVKLDMFQPRSIPF